MSENSSATSADLSGKGGVQGNLWVAKGAVEIGSQISETRSKSRSRARNLSPRVAALSGLKAANIPLIVDDFHYLPRDLQGSIVRALKQPIFDGLPVAIIAIPHRRYDAVRVEKEMTGRIATIGIPAWSGTELRFIPAKGFELLGLTAPDPIIDRMAAEAIGSPHLMQEFCRTICRTMQEGNHSGELSHWLSNDRLQHVFREVADTIGRPIFDKLARGPRQRVDRIPRELRTGQTVDIYQLVLHALAHLRPGLVSLEYEDLRGAIREVSATQIPQLRGPQAYG